MMTREQQQLTNGLHRMMANFAPLADPTPNITTPNLFRRRRETDALRSLFGGRKVSIEGPTEIMGYPPGNYGWENQYPPTVGLSWGDVGHALNPMTYYHMAARGLGFEHSGAPRPPMQPARPTAPVIPPGFTQALARGPALLLSYMGLGSLIWTSGDTVTEKPMEAEPQAAFRGRRLVIAQAKSSGATGVLVTITSPLNVSGMPQTPAPDSPAPVEMFDAATTYSMLDLQIATSGTKITLGISVSAIPASGQTVAVSAGLYGEWQR
jgi:hypothetical protein